jgi:hypothetical protein
MIKDLLSKRFNAKHWDRSRQISQEKIDYITDCLHKAPSKMSMLDYKVVLITDSRAGIEIKKWLFYEHTWNFNGERAPEEFDSEGHRDYNGQYRAPILLAWLNPTDSASEGIVNGERVVFPNFRMRQNNIFISNSIAMLAAEEQGLNTGFGSCHDNNEVATRLGFPGYSCPIVLGIGYALDMSEDIANENYKISIKDPNEPNRFLGTCLVNLPAHYKKPNRLLRSPKEELITVV